MKFDFREQCKHMREKSEREEKVDLFKKAKGGYRMKSWKNI